MLGFTIGKKQIAKFGYSRDGMNSSLIVFFWYAIVITDIVRKIPVLTSMTEIFRNVIYAIVIVGALWSATKRHQWKFLLYPAVIITVPLIFSILIYPELLSLRTDFMLLYGRCLFGFYLAATVNDWNDVLERLVSFHWIGLIYSVLVLTNGRAIYSNYMSLSYGLLIPAMITLFYGIKQKKIVNIISASVMIVAICTYGARGPVVCIAAAFVSLYYLNLSNQMRIRDIVILPIVLIAIGLFVANYDAIVNDLYIKWPDSRTVSLLYLGRFFEESGRDRIYSLMLNELLRSPILPRGLLADRIFLAKASNAQLSSGLYPHNFFIEIWFQFGLLGLILSVCYLGKLISLFLRIKRKSQYSNRVVFSVFVIMATVKLMLSGTYFSDMQSWFCFGAILNLSVLTKSSPCGESIK